MSEVGSAYSHAVHFYTAAFAMHATSCSSESICAIDRSVLVIREADDGEDTELPVPTHTVNIETEFPE